MKKIFIKIKLTLYAIWHFLWKFLKDPLILLVDIDRSVCFIKDHGIKKFINQIFRGYLPKKYLLKTKIHIRIPSDSIRSKLKIYRRDDDSLEDSNIHQVNAKINILIIRTGAMGDVLLATPIVNIIYKKYEGLCSITFATRYTNVFDNNPYISKVISIKELRGLEKKYDVIIDLDSTYEKNRFLHISKSYHLIAFGTDSYNEILQPELFPNKKDEEIVEKFLREVGGPYIVCHNRIDLSQPYRNVPVGNWEILIQGIINKARVKIIQIGSKEMDVGLDNGARNLIDARGMFNIQQSKLLISSAKLFLGTDAGPLHIAATTSTPIVSFFTIAHHQVREPLRVRGLAFSAITPNIDCYGCQNKYAFDVEWKCIKQEFPCTSQFNINKALDDCLSLII